METIYGRNTGNYQALSALSTLAFDYPRRAELFRGELEALLLMAREQHRDPLDYQGSYAGALGLPQFLPSSVRNYAVDFDGDGQIDLLNSPPTPSAAWPATCRCTAGRAARRWPCAPASKPAPT